MNLLFYFQCAILANYTKLKNLYFQKTWYTFIYLFLNKDFLHCVPETTINKFQSAVKIFKLGVL